MDREKYLIDKERYWQKQMEMSEVNPKDIEEVFIRSSGPGGQNVNKVSTCVCLIHRPTGIMVKCQESRSQNRNRYLARARLIQKIKDRHDAEVLAQRSIAEKKRRKNRKRPVSLKEKILESKHLQSEKKSARKAVRYDGED